MKKVLIYCNKDKIGAAALQTLGTALSDENIDFATENLKNHIRSGEYGLIIDTSTIGKKSSETGVVDTVLQPMSMPQPPQVVRIYSPTTTLVDVVNTLTKYGGKHNGKLKTITG